MTREEFNLLRDTANGISLNLSDIILPDAFETTNNPRILNLAEQKFDLLANLERSLRGAFPDQTESITTTYMTNIRDRMVDPTSRKLKYERKIGLVAALCAGIDRFFQESQSSS